MGDAGLEVVGHDDRGHALKECVLSSHFPWSFHQDFPSVIIRFSLVRSSGFPGNYRDNSLVTEV